MSAGEDSAPRLTIDLVAALAVAACRKAYDYEFERDLGENN